jgi:hypothetical protein
VARSIVLELCPASKASSLDRLSSAYSFSVNGSTASASPNVTYGIMLTAVRDVVHVFLNGNYVGEIRHDFFRFFWRH